MTKVYVTQNSEYPVRGLTPEGLEIVGHPPEHPFPRHYGIVGFSDPEKFERWGVMNQRVWKDKSSGEIVSEQELDSRLERRGRSGLRIVARLLNEQGAIARGSEIDTPDELLTSVIREVRE